jgi:hypothetical protein
MIKEYLLIAIAIGFAIYIAIATYPNDRRVIDCSIAEISPDYSLDMKESCRKARIGNENRTQ